MLDDQDDVIYSTVKKRKKKKREPEPQQPYLTQGKTWIKTIWDEMKISDPEGTKLIRKG